MGLCFRPILSELPGVPLNSNFFPFLSFLESTLIENDAYIGKELKSVSY